MTVLSAPSRTAHIKRTDPLRIGSLRPLPNDPRRRNRQAAHGSRFKVKFVRFATLLDYGMAVINKLKKDSGEEATLIYNRESNSMLFTDYSDFFERHTDEEGYDGIRLRKGKTEHDLFMRFIGSIPVELQNIMADSSLITRYVLKKAA